MNGEQQVAAPRQRTRAEVQELVSEFVKRYAAERVLPQPRSEPRNAGSPSEEAAVEEEGEERPFSSFNKAVRNRTRRRIPSTASVDRQDAGYRDFRLNG